MYEPLSRTSSLDMNVSSSLFGQSKSLLDQSLKIKKLKESRCDIVREQLRMSTKESYSLADLLMNTKEQTPGRMATKNAVKLTKEQKLDMIITCIVLCPMILFFGGMWFHDRSLNRRRRHDVLHQLDLMISIQKGEITIA